MSDSLTETTPTQSSPGTSRSSYTDADWRRENILKLDEQAIDQVNSLGAEPLADWEKHLLNLAESLPEPPRFDQDVLELMLELQALLVSKHHDYGPFNVARSPGGPLNGLRVRLHDKLARINHLIDSNQAAIHEPLRDSFVDLANYAVIGLMVIDGKWPA